MRSADVTDVVYGQASHGVMDQVLRKLAVVQSTSTDTLTFVMEEVLEHSTSSMHMLLITNRNLDLQNDSQFGYIKNHPRSRTVAQKARIIQSNTESIDQLFSLDKS